MKDATKLPDRPFRLRHERKNALAQHSVTATICQGKGFGPCRGKGDVFRAFVISDEIPGKVESQRPEPVLFPEVGNGGAGTATHVDNARSGGETAPGQAPVRQGKPAGAEQRSRDGPQRGRFMQSG